MLKKRELGRAVLRGGLPELSLEVSGAWEPSGAWERTSVGIAAVPWQFRECHAQRKTLQSRCRERLLSQSKADAAKEKFSEVRLH